MDRRISNVTGTVSDKDVRVRSLLEYGDDVGRLAEVTAVVSGPIATVQATYAGRISEGVPADDFALKEMRYAQCYVVIVCVFGEQIDIDGSNAMRQE
ncbi:hypothetical protein [Luteibacter aegosomatissinici]|uniref:hypothetical protein n=1 Tax=Luteibacter aegosomatissinici TaxID=2911539 RepID=UPI001FF99FEE|nr:hypothetical protein [Luteibacter aegosomatissinici]UPG93918.1 hypothetical protein L2Y97_19095 [Luteibacter aegosomatissinici]